MLWDHYVYRRGGAVHELWDCLYSARAVRVLYITGRGFDVRAQAAMREYVANLCVSGRKVESAKLLLIGFSGYELDEDILQLTEENAHALEAIFKPLGGTVQTINVDASFGGSSGEDIGASNALRLCVQQVLESTEDVTDVMLDVSSLPRMAYLALLIGILNKLVADKIVVNGAKHPLAASGVAFQVIVAEDAHLDGVIKAEDPSNELVQIPGFSGGFHAESVKDWPLVWFPILGENRVGQLEKVLTASDIGNTAEICPVVPHPSKNPRRADALLIEYLVPLFKTRRTPTSNIVFVHESNRFEAYRQLLATMRRYQHSMNLLGNCRLLVTPLSSKLITIGAGLACFEMRPADFAAKYRIALPLAEPKRYIASVQNLRQSSPDISVLLLTGDAYA